VGKRFIQVSGELLPGFFGSTGPVHYEVVENALPKDAKLVDARVNNWNYRRPTLEMLFESAEWTDSEGTCPEPISLMIRNLPAP
jgi:hypothetical protein